MSTSIIAPISIRGHYFVKDGNRFTIIGVVYQPRHTRGTVPREEDFDPLRDDCLDDIRKDILLFKELGINAIKVYTILPTASHNAVFEALAAAGIYVLLGLSTPRKCINRLRPCESYTTELLKHYIRTVDCVSHYDNVLGVVAADHVINDADTSRAAEVIRAVIRDIKTHMRRQYQSKGQRILPFGIADEAFPARSTDSIDYFTAGDKDERIDFYSFVNYDQVTDPSNHWDVSAQRFAGRDLPIFVSEYGNNTIRPRPFYEATSLYSKNISCILSGGFAYDFIEGPNRYGLVTADHQKLEDFKNLKERFREVTTIEDDAASDLHPSSNIQVAEFPSVSAS